MLLKFCLVLSLFGTGLSRKNTPDFIDSIRQELKAGRNLRSGAIGDDLICESHHVTTLDNVKLQMFRLAHEKNTNHQKTPKIYKRPERFPGSMTDLEKERFSGEEKDTTFSEDSHKPTRPVVFMQHGLGSSSDIFVLTQTESLAYILFKKGYDVWLGNFRGNQYSVNSTGIEIGQTVVLERNDFWDHSFYEMALYDLPAQINYVLDLTENEKVHYVGHSMGTLTMFLTLDHYSADIDQRNQTKIDPRVKYPDAEDNYFDMTNKIFDFHALGPVFTLASSNNPIFDFSRNRAGYFIVRNFVFRHLLYKLPFGIKPDSDDQTKNSHMIKMVSKFISPETFARSFGINPQAYPEKYRAECVTHVPQTTSFKTMYHFAELIKFGNLAAFPYQKGWSECSWWEKKMSDVNRLYCRTEEASKNYDLQNIENVNVYIYSGELDGLSNPQEGKDIKKLMEAKNHVEFFEFEGVDHMGLCADERAPELIYPRILEGIEKSCEQRKHQGMSC